jgi:GntR family transcriptional regulator
MARHSDGRPGQYKIAAEIRAQILSGDLPPGAKLGTTAELMAHYSVANNTIQRALGVLKDEGYLVGEKGKGVFVAATQRRTIVASSSIAPGPIEEPYWWTRSAAAEGKSGTTDLLEVGYVVPPADVRERLRLDQTGVALLRKRVLRLDGEPVELCRSYYPRELAEGTALENNGLIRGGSPRLLADMGYPSLFSDDDIAVRPPTTEEVLLLELPQEVHILRTLRVVYSDEQRPIEVTEMIKGGHLYTLRYRIPLA